MGLFETFTKGLMNAHEMLNRNFATTETSLQNKANYISHGATPTDVLSVLGDGTHKCWAWTNRPPVFGDGQAYVTAKDWALQDGIVTYGRRNYSSAYGGSEWENVCVNKVWSGWYPIATATPPQEFDLPLIAGFTKMYDLMQCNYSKDQFNRVHVKGAIRSETPFGINVAFANLPIGFCPAIGTEVDVPAMFSVAPSVSFFPGRVFVRPEGYMMAVTSSAYETTELVFEFSFLAVSVAL